VHRVDDAAVVAGDRRVEVGGAAREVGAQPPRIEDRQADRRADAVLRAARLQQPVEAEGRQADEGDEVDVRIELRLRGGDVAGRRLDAPARGDDVGATAEQVGGTMLGQRARRAPRRAAAPARRRRRAARRRARRGHGRRQRDLLVDGFDLRPRLRQRAFAEVELGGGVEAGETRWRIRPSTWSRCSSERCSTSRCSSRRASCT
jgi:hypothetical protein